jgi:imidazole glycerol-phosphate synthase subunit HisH
MKVAIIDYGAGNLTSLRAAFLSIGATVCVTAQPAQIQAADRIVVPGVGHFSATSHLRESGLDELIRNAVAHGVPLLGICLGMQWLFSGSEEAPDVAGLGMLSGVCKRFVPGLKIPHVGWNQLQLCNGASRLLQGVPDGSHAYFTHSYRIDAADQTVATTEYGGKFSSVVEQGTIFGVQFHPEKSSAIGLRILRNFCSLPC